VWKKLREFGTQLTRPERGQTNVEYALILLLVAIATVVLLTTMAQTTSGTLLGSVASRFP